MQTVLSALIVVGCTGYAVWTLFLPASLRQGVLRRLGRSTPERQGCGGCTGCDHDPAATSAGPPVVHWQPRRRG